MKVLFATTNPAKIRKYAEKLQEKNIEVLTLKDLNINLHVEENGKNSLENAEIKARAYYEASKIITISMDCSLFNLPPKSKYDFGSFLINNEISSDCTKAHLTSLTLLHKNNAVLFIISIKLSSNGSLNLFLINDEKFLPSKWAIIYPFGINL